MMRWQSTAVFLTLALSVALGCKQQLFMSEADYDHYKMAALAPGLERPTTTTINPVPAEVPQPTTVLDPERPIRYITLHEAIATALEQGTVGIQSPFFPGALNDILITFQNPSVGSSDSIRVLALDPAIVGTNIESSLSKFDARWITSANWSTTDRPVGTTLDNFQSQAAGGVNNIGLQDATVSSQVLKPLPTGGVAGITFSTAYELSNLAPRVNPSYRPTLQFQFEQPLLQGFGVDINQLRSAHPNSVLTPFQIPARTEGILLTRIRYDEQKLEFQRNVNYMLVNVEISYWNLYGAYWALYSREQALRQAFEAWKINKARYEAGRIPIQDFAQSRQQYELFRGQRITALGQVLENERQLRGLMGLPVEDGYRLVPIDTPTLTPYQPDWCTALNEALSMRPEVALARQDLKFRQLDLINQRNLLLPDVRFTSTYDFNSIGTRLDGPGAGNAFRNLSQGNFSNWAVGIQANIPIGFRDAHSAVRAARLNLARSYGVLQDQEMKAQRYLAVFYRRLFEYYEQIRAQRAQREAAAQQLDARFKEFLAGRGTLDILLEAQRFWADALRGEYDAVVQYNNALASFQFAKGTIMQHDNVSVTDGPLPEVAQVRAVEHEKQRSLALVARERSNKVVVPVSPVEGGNLIGVPNLPTDKAPSLPALLDGQQPTPDLNEQLPSPRSTSAVAPVPQPTSPAVTPVPAAATAPAKSTSAQPLVNPPAPGSK
jgi:outer membrane protein TolC